MMGLDQGSRIKDQGSDQGSRHDLRLEYDGIGARSTTADCRLPLVGDPHRPTYQYLPPFYNQINF